MKYLDAFAFRRESNVEFRQRDACLLTFDYSFIIDSLSAPSRMRMLFAFVRYSSGFTFAGGSFRQFLYRSSRFPARFIFNSSPSHAHSERTSGKSLLKLIPSSYPLRFQTRGIPRFKKFRSCNVQNVCEYARTRKKFEGGFSGAWSTLVSHFSFFFRERRLSTPAKHARIYTLRKKE